MSAATLPFGPFDVYGGAVSATGGISGSCTNAQGSTANIQITLDNGNHLTGSNRGMTCSTCTGFTSDVLQYQIYTDAAHTAPWTGTTSVAATCSHCGGSGGGTWGPVTMYGVIFQATAGGMNDVAAGTGYSDSVTMTINY